MTEALARLCDAMASSLPPTPFVGAGFASVVTGDAAHVGRHGLLVAGIEVCEQLIPRLPPAWARRMKDQIDSSDVITQLAIADEITRRLRDAPGGSGFDSWIQRTIGGLRPTPAGRQIIMATRSLGPVIVTTNYDTLIEDLEPRWSSKTWTDKDYMSSLRAREIVVHLHGVAGKPASIILGSANYAQLDDDEPTQISNKSLFASHRFVFIGCGDSINDPDIAPLIDFVKNILPGEDTEHYILVRGHQLRQFDDRPLSALISPVAYGRSFAELTPFLQKLAAGEEIEVSQDPMFYEKGYTAEQRTSLLDLAVPAQKKLQDSLDSLLHAIRAIGEVERRIAVPIGMNDQNYAEQKATHEQLAASVVDPAEHLEVCLVQVVPAFEDAQDDLGRLTAPRFARYATQLRPIIETVAELKNLSMLLLDRVTKAQDDLDDRTDICASYRIPLETLHRTYQLAEEVWYMTTSLKKVLDRLQTVQATEETRASRPGYQRPDLYMASDKLSAPVEPGLPLVPSVISSEQRASRISEGDQPRPGLQAPVSHGGHVFISYVREDSPEVDRLQQVLEAAGIRVWRDTADLWPGEDWRAKIRHAITGDALVFLACYSHKSLARKKSYQNQELNVAIEQMQLRRPDEPWLIPVRFDNCNIPDRDIGGGRSLASIHAADLFDDGFHDGATKLIVAIERILGRQNDLS